MKNFIVAVSYSHKGVIDSKFWRVEASTKSVAEKRAVILMQGYHVRKYGLFAPSEKYLAVADTVTTKKALAIGMAHFYEASTAAGWSQRSVKAVENAFLCLTFKEVALAHYSAL